MMTDWLNCDLYPHNDATVVIDATKPFPIPDASFQFAFSEHMIEHMNFEDGARFLAECFRSLRPGGAIRISTPNMRFLFGLYERQDYVKWSARTFGLPPITAAVINNYFRAWGPSFYL
jgi:predicted SAM-dependent methyltransferase